MFRLSTVFLFLAMLLPAVAAAQEDSSESFLVIIMDDMGIDKIGAYGFEDTSGNPVAARTPNIDRLASQGILFRNAWAAPACSTCRAEVMTGKYPNRTGIGSHVAAQDPGYPGLRADELTIPDVLPDNYVSALIGKWHLAGGGPDGGMASGIDHAPRCGFDAHVGSKGNVPNYFDWDLVLSFLSNLSASTTVALVGEYATSRTTTDTLRTIHATGDRPFFVVAAYNAPHKPFHVPPVELFDGTGLDLDSEFGKGVAMIEAVDTEIGRLIAGLGPDVLSRTTIIFLSDNGAYRELAEPPWDPFKLKGTVYNGGINVPLIVVSNCMPIQLQGTEETRLVDCTDLMPTIAEMAGSPIPQGIDGHSFLPYIEGQGSDSVRPWIYAERYKPNFVPQPGQTISSITLRAHDQTARDDRFKLVRRRSYDLLGVLILETTEFYDVANDYYERNDLLDASGIPPARLLPRFEELKRVLDRMAD
jgi:arylsulfatase A-like enzyme